MERFACVTLALGAALLAAVPVFSQQSFSATYDRNRQVKLQGTVTRIDWVNPHAFFFIDVRDATGTVTNWAVEFGRPLDLERNGWKWNSLRIGDAVTVEGVPNEKRHKTGIRQLRRLVQHWQAIVHRTDTALVIVVSRAGSTLAGRPGQIGTSSREERVLGRGERKGIDRERRESSDERRWPAAEPRRCRQGRAVSAVGEGAVRVSPTEVPGRRPACSMSPARRAAAISYHEWVSIHRAARVGPHSGSPRGGNRNWRVIYTDGRPQGQPAEVVLSYYGNSVGHWEKDTLVVDSAGFNEKFWFTNGGLPHTEALHLTERFTRQDLNTLKYEVIVDDPRTYTRPWSGGWTIQWVADQEIQEYFCEENAESTFVR